MSECSPGSWTGDEMGGKDPPIAKTERRTAENMGERQPTTPASVQSLGLGGRPATKMPS